MFRFDKTMMISYRMMIRNRFYPQFTLNRDDMLTVKKFLCCFQLETGGYFLGWCGIVSSLFLMIAFISSLAFSLQDIVDYINMRFAVTDKNQLPISSNDVNRVSFESDVEFLDDFIIERLDFL